MVFGEPQILGQLKSAYRAAHTRGMTGSVLNRLFHRAFAAAKTVRTKTEIGRNAVSVCFAVRELGSQVFGDLKSASVMLIGTGEMGILSLKHFRAAGTEKFFVVSGALRRAASAAESFSAIPLVMSNFAGYLAEADIIVGARALEVGEEPYLGLEAAQAAARKRAGRPQLFVDLGVPRNFTPEIEDLPDAFLYTIDDMEGLVQQNIEARKAAKIDADRIIDKEVENFTQWLERRQADPVIKALRERAQLIEAAEVERTISRLRSKGCEPKTLAIVESELLSLSHRLSAKLLHRPYSGIKEEVKKDTKVVGRLKKLFLG
jgi:glutamyl-tRNA reductase